MDSVEAEETSCGLLEAYRTSNVEGHTLTVTDPLGNRGVVYVLERVCQLTPLQVERFSAQVCKGLLFFFPFCLSFSFLFPPIKFLLFFCLLFFSFLLGFISFCCCSFFFFPLSFSTFS